MKTDDTLVRDYLAAVARESSALPPAARQELVADLGEHIEVALAERPGAVREILQEVGDPRTIAASALQELGPAPATPAPAPATPAPVLAPALAPAPAPGAPPAGRARRRRSPVWLPLALILVGEVVPYAGEHGVWALLALALKLVAIVIVCRSFHWDGRRKGIGLVLTVALPAVLKALWNVLFALPEDRSSPEAVRWTVVALAFALTVAGCGYLWRTARR